MHIRELLVIQLKKEILQYLIKLYETNNIQMNSVLFRKICSKKINSKIDNIQFLTQTNSTSIDERDRCCSRIWDNHYGTRCNYKKIVNEDYCRHHLNMIQKNGRLVFNRYDEDKPMYNEKNNRIPWFTNCLLYTSPSPRD